MAGGEGVGSEVLKCFVRGGPNFFYLLCVCVWCVCVCVGGGVRFSTSLSVKKITDPTPINKWLVPITKSAHLFLKILLVKLTLSSLLVCVCVYSNSRNDVPRVAQRYGTIAAHTRRRASVIVVFVVFCMHMYSFAGLIRRTPPPTFSDTAVTDRHSDTTIFQLRAHWVRISWSIGSEKSFGHVPPVGVEPSTSCMQGEHPIH